MRRIVLFLMCVCAVSMANALTITNGNFETGAGNNIANVTGWYDNNTGGFWEDAWQTNSGSITPNGTTVVVFSSFDTVAGNSLAGSYLYQSIGASTGESSVTIGFDWGFPNDVGAGRHDGLTISTYASNGTFVAGDAVDINGAAGVTLLDSASYDAVALGTDGEILPVVVTLDLSGASAGDEIFLRFNNYLPATTESWPILDNVEILTIDNNSPANGATNVPVVRTSPANDLVFTVFKASITKVDVQFGTENDPNLTSKPANKIVSNLAVTPGQYTVNLESLAADLSNDKTYYWKVIGYEPNALDPSGFIQISGPVSSFKTAPATALISAVSPAYTAVNAGQNVVLSATGVSVTNYQWYKIGSPDVQLVNGADYTGVTTNTLTILDTQLGDEGNYYCIGSNGLPSSASNRDTGSGRVLTKRLTSDYPFEVMNVVDGNNVTPDVVGGFNMTMANEAASAGLPVLAADVVAATLGTYSLMFDNLDEATDPNGQYALIANNVAKFEDITIAVWVKFNGGVDWQRIYDIGASTTSYMFLSPKAGGAGLRFAITTGSGEQMLNAPALTVGEWTYVAVTIGGDTGRLYVNGKLVDTNTGMTLNPIAVTQTHNLVGKSQWNDPELNGLIDDLKIYDYARTTVQIAKDYLAVKGEWICNMELTALPYDFDGNCKIDLGDFAMFAATWLETNRITLP